MSDLANLWAVGGEQVSNPLEEVDSEFYRYCPNCGWRLTSKFSTCPRCGADLSLQRCPYCGGVIHARVDQCPRCTALLI